MAHKRLTGKNMRTALADYHEAILDAIEEVNRVKSLHASLPQQGDAATVNRFPALKSGPGSSA